MRLRAWCGVSLALVLGGGACVGEDPTIATPPPSEEEGGNPGGSDAASSDAPSSDAAGGSDANESDGGAIDSGALDGSVSDAGATDGGGLDGGSLDGGDAADALGVPFCSAQAGALLCEDFEGLGTFPDDTVWESDESGGTIVKTTGHGSLSGARMSGTIPTASPFPTGASLRYPFDFAGGDTKLEVSFRFRIDTPSAGTLRFPFVYVELDSTLAFRLELRGDGNVFMTTIDTGSSGTTAFGGQALAQGQWLPVTLTFDSAGGGSVSINGMTVTLVHPSFATGDPKHVRIGAFTSGESSSIGTMPTVSFDDVAIKLE